MDQDRAEAQVRIIGRAMTHGSQLPIDSGDPIEASRAVRRALADAGRKAVDIERFILASTSRTSEAGLRAFARRALGSRSGDVVLTSISADGTAEEQAMAACEVLDGERTAVWRTGLAVGLDDRGSTVAWCVTR